MKKLLPILIALPVFLLSLIFLRPEATSPVVVAATDLLEGHILVASDITIMQVPKSQAPQGAVQRPIPGDRPDPACIPWPLAM